MVAIPIVVKAGSPAIGATNESKEFLQRGGDTIIQVIVRVERDEERQEIRRNLPQVY